MKTLKFSEERVIYTTGFVGSGISVAMLVPGRGKMHRAHPWDYVTGVFELVRTVVYDCTISYTC